MAVRPLKYIPDNQGLLQIIYECIVWRAGYEFLHAELFLIMGLCPLEGLKKTFISFWHIIVDSWERTATKELV
jgi:hypothetical protein